MKITLQQISEGEEEIIFRYKSMNEELEAILHFAETRGRKLTGTGEENDNRNYLFAPGEVYYFESVDGMVYAYLKEGVFRIREGLGEVLALFMDSGFVRCSRTMVVNIYKMESLKSEPGGKILAVLCNGEKIMISRKYARELKEILKNGKGKGGRT